MTKWHFLDDLKKHIEGNGFSIEMLDYCRMCFQCGGFTEEDEEEFKKILSERVREKLPDIEAYLDEALVVLCINRGVHEIVDVYFYGDVAYSKKRSVSEKIYISLLYGM